MIPLTPPMDGVLEHGALTSLSNSRARHLKEPSQDSSPPSLAGQTSPLFRPQFPRLTVTRPEWIPETVLTTLPHPPCVYHKPLELSKPKGGPCSHPHHEPAAGPFPKPSQGALPTQPPSGHSSGATVHRAARGMRLPSAPASAGIMYAPHRAPVTQSQPVCGGRDSP